MFKWLYYREVVLINGDLFRKFHYSYKANNIYCCVYSFNTIHNYKYKLHAHYKLLGIITVVFLLESFTGVTKPISYCCVLIKHITINTLSCWV